MKKEGKKKGLRGFFKKEKEEISDYEDITRSLFNDEKRETEKITDFFSKDKMKISEGEDLSRLINKLQTQKSGLDIIDLNKKDDEISEIQEISNTKTSFVTEKEKQESMELSSQNTFDTNINKPEQELEKILGKIKSHRSQQELLENNDNNAISKEKSKIIGLENLQKTTSGREYAISDDFEKNYSNSEIKYEINESDVKNSIENISNDKKEDHSKRNTENKENSGVDIILDRIRKAESMIEIKKEQDASTNILLEKDISPKKNVSELEKILGKIKSAESSKEKKTDTDAKKDSEITKSKDLDVPLKQETEAPPALKDHINKITIEKEDDISHNKYENKKFKGFSYQDTASGSKNINASSVAGDISDSDKIDEEEQEIKEERPFKKYTPNRTIWSQSEPEEEDQKYQGDEDISRKPIYSAKKTRWSGNNYEIDDKKAGLVSAEDIQKGYSGLILPEGATFEVEEFKLKSIQKELEPEEHDETISKINKIYSEYFPQIDLEKISDIDLSEKKKKEKPKIFNLFKAQKIDKNEYNPSIHGPIVDLSFSEAEGIEEIELYPVNEPYAYVRIVYDKNTNEYIYNAIEPVLNDAEKKLLSEIEQRLFETLDVNTKDLTKEKAKEILKDSVYEIISDYGLRFNPAEREKIIYHINREFLGDGLIDPIMHDKYIEDISCDGLNTPIFVFHSNYESLQTNLYYAEPTVLDSFVTKLAQKAGKYISIAEPMLDATMTDGSRIQMTLGTEVTAHGSTFTIRKFKDEPITPTDLTEWGTFSPLSIAYIWLAVEAGKSCIFAGGTASGKTTSLNAISLFIPPLAKIVTLEDTRELKLPHQNWIPSITRESFDKDGKGSIDMYELLRAALRQRPEYILVGEVRGAEAQTLFQAMSTGHVTYATMHADSVASAVHRIENPPLNVPRNMLSSLDLMSVQVQVRIGGQRTRRNKQLIEILDIDPRTKELITNEVFKWNQATDEIRYSGKSYILEDIMESRGWDESRMVEELKRRQEILEWMRLKKLRNYKDVGKVLMSYYRDPEAVIKLVREDLYE